MSHLYFFHLFVLPRTIGHPPPPPSTHQSATSTMAPTPIWHCTLTLEALLQVCENEDVLRFLFQTFDQAPASKGRVPVFSALVRSVTLFLFRFLEDCGAGDGTGSEGSGGGGSGREMMASVAGAVVASAAGAGVASGGGPSTGGVQLSAAAKAAAKRRADASRQTASGMSALGSRRRVRAMMAGGVEVDGVARAAGVGSSHGLGLGVVGIMDLLGEDEPPELIAAGAALLAANCVLSVSKVMSRAEILLIKAQERAPSPSPSPSASASSSSQRNGSRVQASVGRWIVCRVPFRCTAPRCAACILHFMHMHMHCMHTQTHSSASVFLNPTGTRGSCSSRSAPSAVRDDSEFLADAPLLAFSTFGDVQRGGARSASPARVPGCQLGVRRDGHDHGRASKRERHWPGRCRQCASRRSSRSPRGKGRICLGAMQVCPSDASCPT